MPTKTKKASEPKKHKCKPSPEQKAVIAAAVEVVKSNGRPDTVVELAHALNASESPDVKFNPFGATPHEKE